MFKQEKKYLLLKLDQSKEMMSAYKEGYEALEKGDTYFAAQKFLTELLFQSLWVPKSALMAAYSFYLQNFYSEAILNLRYLNTTNW